MIPAPFEYVRPASLEEALDALGEPDAQALAGGHSLLPLMKLRLARPSLLVDIGGLPLRGVALVGGEVRVGALSTWDDLAGAGGLLMPELSAVSECAASIGDVQVRNRGTVGGGVAHADPASDFPAVCLAFGARLRLRSASGERELPTTDFLLGPFTTALEPQELLVELAFPRPPQGSGSAYISIEHPGSGFALVGAAALVRADGSQTVALTGVAARPFVYEGSLDCIELLGDRFAPADYRRRLAEVVVRRALERAQARCR
jgi:aerobic carbon-monoxide dehydrogenase medium subunit